MHLQRYQQILSSASCPLQIAEVAEDVVGLMESVLKESIVWLPVYTEPWHAPQA